MKIYQYLRLHMKMISRRFYIITLFTFWDIRTRGIWNVCLQTCRNNRICLKVVYFLRKTQTSRVNNSRILRFKNATFSECSFHIEPSILWKFQICISVPLKENQQGGGGGKSLGREGGKPTQPKLRLNIYCAYLFCKW